MFSKEELKSLDRKYFAVIVADEYDVTVMSRNTGITGTSTTRSIRGKAAVLSFISIRHHIRIISMVGRIRCGRRCGASRGMISG